MSPFKKTDEGWEYDPKGKARVRSAKSGVFDKPAPRVRVFDGETGYEKGLDGEIDWKKIIDEANRKES